MQALDLNLASRPFRNNTMLWLGHGAAVLLLAVFAVWNVRSFVLEGRAYRETKASLRSVERRLVDLDERERRATSEIERYDTRDLEASAATANAFILRKALSWTRLFNLLETVVPHEVRMTAIRPIFQAQRGGSAEGIAESVPVGVEGTARSLEAFLELERALITDRHFSQIEPEKTDVIDSGEVQFDLRFLYFPDGRIGERDAVDLPHVLEAAAEEPATSRELEALERAQQTPAPPPISGAPAPQRGRAAPIVQPRRPR